MTSTRYDPARHPRDVAGRFAAETSSGGRPNTGPSTPRPEPTDGRRAHATVPRRGTSGIRVTGPAREGAGTDGD